MPGERVPREEPRRGPYEFLVESASLVIQPTEALQPPAVERLSLQPVRVADHNRIL
jgi:hypothetical protein